MDQPRQQVQTPQGDQPLGARHLARIAYPGPAPVAQDPGWPISPFRASRSTSGGSCRTTGRRRREPPRPISSPHRCRTSSRTSSRRTTRRTSRASSPCPGRSLRRFRGGHALETPLLAAAQLNSGVTAAQRQAPYTVPCGSGPGVDIDGRTYVDLGPGHRRRSLCAPSDASSLCAYSGAVHLTAGTHTVTAEDVERPASRSRLCRSSEPCLRATRPRQCLGDQLGDRHAGRSRSLPVRHQSSTCARTTTPDGWRRWGASSCTPSVWTGGSRAGCCRRPIRQNRSPSGSSPTVPSAPAWWLVRSSHWRWWPVRSSPDAADRRPRSSTARPYNDTRIGAEGANGARSLHRRVRYILGCASLLDGRDHGTGLRRGRSRCGCGPGVSRAVALSGSDAVPRWPGSRGRPKRWPVS